MEKEKEKLMHKNSPYALSTIILTTKHSKSIAIAPSFLNLLSAEMIEYSTDTDKLGTFSGEIERIGNPLDCAKIKCQLGMNLTDSYYGLSSEGSFGPHPYMPFLPCDHEILYFIDHHRDFHLYVSCFSEKTNYNMQALDSMEELEKFSAKALFPSHALILRPDNKQNKSHIFKGINSIDMLETAFKDSIKRSTNGKVWVETDMRANMNPLRMSVIQGLAEELARRLSALCPKCENPGWGKVQAEKGLACSLCGTETELLKAEIYGCAKCDHKEKISPSHHLLKADPGNCSYCNP
jgi:hypothetical protein